MRYMTPFFTRPLATHDLFADFGTLLKDFNQDLPVAKHGWFAPALDLEEKADKFIVQVDIPGMSKEDIKIDFHEGVLAVSGERVHERSDKGHFERSIGTFTRKVSLPSSVNEEAVEAKYENGVLRIEIPKQEKEKKRTITVS